MLIKRIRVKLCVAVGAITGNSVPWFVQDKALDGRGWSAGIVPMWNHIFHIFPLARSQLRLSGRTRNPRAKARQTTAPPPPTARPPTDRPPRPRPTFDFWLPAGRRPSSAFLAFRICRVSDSLMFKFLNQLEVCFFLL